MRRIAIPIIKCFRLALPDRRGYNYNTLCYNEIIDSAGTLYTINTVPIVNSAYCSI